MDGIGARRVRTALTMFLLPRCGCRSGSKALGLHAISLFGSLLLLRPMRLADGLRLLRVWDTLRVPSRAMNISHLKSCHDSSLHPSSSHPLSPPF